MRRLVPTLALVALLVLAAAAQAPAATPRVVGGQPVDGSDAPWAVFIVSTVTQGAEATVAFCSGTLTTATTVVTAAHCTDRPLGSYRVWAGWTLGPDGRTIAESFEQSQPLASVRVHPGYAASEHGSLDDIAVMELAAPLDVSGPRVRPIALADAPPAPGAAFRAYGFGIPSLGQLRAFTAVTQPRWACGVDASWICGGSPDGQACGGDSGGGLIAAGGAPRLVAVTDVASTPCQVGGFNGYTDVTTPEIRRWLDGDPAPPAAPRRTAAIGALAAAPFPDGAVRCPADGWSGGATLSFQFRDELSGAVLQDGPSAAYLPRPEDAGRTIRCVVSAANAGGTSQDAPPPLRVPTAWNLQVGPEYVTTQFWSLADGQQAAVAYTDVRGREAARVALQRAQDLPLATPSLAVGAYRVCLELTPAPTFTAWRECGALTIDGVTTALVGRGRARRRGATFSLPLHAAGPAVGQRARFTWIAARCAACPGRTLKRGTLTLRAARTLRSPAVRRGLTVRLRLALPTIPVDGASYRGGVLSVIAGRRPR